MAAGNTAAAASPLSVKITAREEERGQATEFPPPPSISSPSAAGAIKAQSERGNDDGLRPHGSCACPLCPIDPTNGCIPGDRHITVALGRDFSDVSPVRGMVLGGGRSDVAVSVDVARVAQTQQQS